MNLTITGHRVQKLENYNIRWIDNAIWNLIKELKTKSFIQGFSGMASGVDLWFCQNLREFNCPYVACVPFKEQEDTMSLEDRTLRADLIRRASKVMSVRNYWMVEKADRGIVVWDGGKGGTANVLQQFIEKKVPFHWINPVSEKVWDCS